MNSLVSVIIPTHKGSNVIVRAIDSVLHQTYNNIEIIVVDDNGLGSEDQLKTYEAIKEYCENKKVKYIPHEINKNGSVARNTGAANATGEFISLLDDDDEFLPSKIEKQVKDLSALDDSYALVYCGLELFSNGKFLEESKKSYSGSIFYEVMMHKAVIGSSSLLIRKSAWTKLNGFDESFRRHQDFEFTARVAYGYKVYAEDFIGVRRHVMYRNDPSNPDVALEYRKHYLNKMEPFMRSLSNEHKQDIYVTNMMDVAFQYLKCHRYLDFIKIYKSIHPGWRGIRIFFFRIKLIIKKHIDL